MSNESGPESTKPPSRAQPAPSSPASPSAFAALATCSAVRPAIVESGIPTSPFFSPLDAVACLGCVRASEVSFFSPVASSLPPSPFMAWAAAAFCSPRLPASSSWIPGLATDFGKSSFAVFGSPPWATRLASEGSGCLPGDFEASPGDGKNWTGIGPSCFGAESILIRPSGSGC